MILRFDLAIFRKVLPSAAIIGAVIYGIHGTLIEPDATKLAEVKVELQRARDQHSESLQLQNAGMDLQRHVDDFKLHLANVRERGLAATDQRELFERISSLAHQSGVELDQVRSLDWKPKTGSAGEAIGQATGSACTLNLSGSYSDICTFVGKVELKLGFATITRLRMQPASEGTKINADMDLACFAPPMGAGSVAAAGETP